MVRWRVLPLLWHCWSSYAGFSSLWQGLFKSAMIIIMFLVYNQLSRILISIYSVYKSPISLPLVNGGAPTYYLQADFSVQVSEWCPRLPLPVVLCVHLALAILSSVFMHGVRPCLDTFAGVYPHARVLHDRGWACMCHVHRGNPCRGRRVVGVKAPWWKRLPWCCKAGVWVVCDSATRRRQQVLLLLQLLPSQAQQPTSSSST